MTGAEFPPGSGYSYNDDFSGIFLEAIRDKIQGFIAAPDFADKFQKIIDETVAHELGHPPGGASANSDHAEPGLMFEGAPQGAQFSPETLKRIRETPKWNP